MYLDSYTLTTKKNAVTFQFESVGPKGAIQKLVQFQKVAEPNVYNLAFGDKHSGTDSIDDLSVSDNGDSEKVLATVVEALYTFCDHHPGAIVYATGSTPARTRLYRMGISRFYDEVCQDFDVYAVLGEELLPFEPGLRCDGFLARRKTT